MSGVRAPHLQRRDGVYHLRIRVPDAIRPQVGKTELVRSLRTYSLQKARPLAALLTALVMETFEMIKLAEMTTHDARKLVQNCFVQVIATEEGNSSFTPRSSEIDLEIREQQVLSEDYIINLRGQIDSNSFDGLVRQKVRDLVIEHGFRPDDLSEARFNDLASGVTRVLVEQQRLFLLRLADRLAPFEPVDELFANSLERVYFRDSNCKHKGPTIADAVQSYLAAHKNIWKLKTLKARRWQLGYLVEFLGDGRPIESIRVDDIREYRNACPSSDNLRHMAG